MVTGRLDVGSGKMRRTKEKVSTLFESQSDKFNEESQDLIADLNNIEIFELYENMPNSNAPTAMPTGK